LEEGEMNPDDEINTLRDELTGLYFTFEKFLDLTESSWPMWEAHLRHSRAALVAVQNAASVLSAMLNDVNFDHDSSHLAYCEAVGVPDGGVSCHQCAVKPTGSCLVCGDSVAEVGRWLCSEACRVLAREKPVLEARAFVDRHTAEDELST
jgi:hypothetical protein